MTEHFSTHRPITWLLTVHRHEQGLFAHQSSTFDTYAGSRQYPMSVSTAAGRTGSRVRSVLSVASACTLPTHKDCSTAGGSALGCFHLPICLCLTYARVLQVYHSSSPVPL